ncbi:MAG: gamma-glutamyl-gamma-aminobutyrate hydrolase [Phycisphaerae bacterium]
MRPRIAITCRYQIRTVTEALLVPEVSVDARFGDLILAGGGMPVLIHPTEDKDVLSKLMETVDAVILTGGPDVPPARYGTPPDPATTAMEPRREATDFAVLEIAERRHLPLLAVCLGVQEWNVFRGGTLHQHVPDLNLDPAIVHRAEPGFAHHDVRLKPGSLIYRIMQTDPLAVNSSHHQALDRLGHDLVPTSWAVDGLVESVEDPHRSFALGVQWHPEDMDDDPLQRRIFTALVQAARAGAT